MAALTTGSIAVPVETAEEIWTKAVDNSTLAKLSKQTPMKFGNVKYMTFTADPKAELVGEGAEKSETPATMSTKTVKPYKLQVTIRMSNEVMWADEDHQLEVWDTVRDRAALALGRGLDLVGYHKLDPLSGAVASSVTEGVTDTTKSVTLANGKYDAAVEAAEALVIAGDYIPNGLAMSPSFYFGLKTQKDADGRRLFTDISEFDGMNTAKSSTVNAPEATVATGINAIVGDFDAFKWGVQREIEAELIQFGDPDGQGDLKRHNQVAIRLEIVYGIAIMDLNAFAKVA